MKLRALFLCLSLMAVCRLSQATVVVIAPHPDDGEASCGGLMANTVAAGEEVILLTMTGGERGILGKSEEDARAIRMEEARTAAGALGIKVEFFGGLDARLESTTANAEKLKEMLAGYNPAVVLAPWPLDVHPDHQATGMLAWRVFHDKDSHFELYFYETSNMPHTKTFQFAPTHYADITDVMKKKQDALYRHKSQLPEAWYDMYKVMAKFRGYESDTTFAEAFIRARNYSSLDGRPAVEGKTLTGDGNE